MSSPPAMVDVASTMMATLSEIGSAGIGRSVVIGRDERRMTGRIERLRIDPSRLATVLDPTSTEHGLTGAFRLPTSLGDFVNPIRDGARAAVAASDAVARSIMAARSGVWEVSAGLEVLLSDVRKGARSARLLEITTGAMTLRSPASPVLHCADVAVKIAFDTDDLMRLVAADGPRSARVDAGVLLVRTRVGPAELDLEIVPELVDGRIRLAMVGLRWGRRSVGLPARWSRRLVRWVEPPERFTLTGLAVLADQIVVTGSAEEWVEPVGAHSLVRLTPRTG